MHGRISHMKEGYIPTCISRMISFFSLLHHLLLMLSITIFIIRECCLLASGSSWPDQIMPGWEPSRLAGWHCHGVPTYQVVLEALVSLHTMAGSDYAWLRAKLAGWLAPPWSSYLPGCTWSVGFPAYRGSQRGWLVPLAWTAMHQNTLCVSWGVCLCARTIQIAETGN